MTDQEEDSASTSEGASETSSSSGGFDNEHQLQNDNDDDDEDDNGNGRKFRGGSITYDYDDSKINTAVSNRRLQQNYESPPETLPNTRTLGASARAAVNRRMSAPTSATTLVINKPENANQRTAKHSRVELSENAPTDTAKRKPSASNKPSQNLLASSKQKKIQHNILPEVTQRRTFFDFMRFDGGVLRHKCTPDEFFLTGDYPQTWDELHDLLRNTQSRLEEDFCDRLQALVDELVVRPELLSNSSSERAGVSAELVTMFNQTALDAVQYLQFQFRHVHDQFERFRNDTRDEIQGLIQEHIIQHLDGRDNNTHAHGETFSEFKFHPEHDPGQTRQRRPRNSSSQTPRQFFGNSTSRPAPFLSAEEAARFRRRMPSNDAAYYTRPGSSSSPRRPPPSNIQTWSSNMGNTAEEPTDEVEQRKSAIQTMLARVFGRHAHKRVQRFLKNPHNLLHMFCCSLLLLCLAILTTHGSTTSSIPPPAVAPLDFPPPAPSLLHTERPSPYYYATSHSLWRTLKHAACKVLPRNTPACRASSETLPFIDRQKLDSYNTCSNPYSTGCGNELHSAGIAQQQQYYKEQMQPAPSAYVDEYSAMPASPRDRPTPMDVLNNYF